MGVRTTATTSCRVWADLDRVETEQRRTKKKEWPRKRGKSNDPPPEQKNAAKSQKAFITLGSPVVPLLSTSKADSGLAPECRWDPLPYTNRPCWSKKGQFEAHSRLTNIAQAARLAGHYREVQGSNPGFPGFLAGSTLVRIFWCCRGSISGVCRP
jgi:hypothetical protein